ncbi:MAG: hypothetical protein MK052_08555 [Alphaproteobacteria bacterium]|nr:hypothetical protein [Alphaproteobacteria bacterium]
MSGSKPIEITATQPNYALKKKLGDDVNIREALTKDAIADAESVIEESKKDFFVDATNDIEAMEEAYNAALTSPESSVKHIKIIERRVFSLKGQSETLGFDLLAHASKSLYEFCSIHFRNDDMDQLVVIRKHLDTINLIIREQLKGDGGRTGKELVHSLHLLTEKYK